MKKCKLNKNIFNSFIIIIGLMFITFGCGESDNNQNNPPPPVTSNPPPQQPPIGPGNPPPYPPNGPYDNNSVELPVGTTVIMSAKKHQGLMESFPYPSMNYPKYRVKQGDILRVRGTVKGGLFTAYYNQNVKCMSTVDAYIPYFINGVSQFDYLSPYDSVTIEQDGVLDFGSPSNYYGSPYRCTKLENFRIEITRKHLH